MSTEYLWWAELVKKTEFFNYLNDLKNKLESKKVIIYCNGIYFDAISDNYNLNDFFEITAISDIRYEQSGEKEYKNFRCIKPSELLNLDFDCILLASPNFQNIERFLKNFGVKQKCMPLYFDNYEQEEKQTQLNYKKVLNNLKSKSKIRALFVCEENAKWSWQRVYDEMKKDSRYEVLPVVLYPIVTKNRVEFTQKENAEFFKRFGVETIDGYDYERKTNRNLEEFKPDIVFYQQPWYLVGANHPIKVSKYALTVMAPYGYTTLNPDFWGSSLVKRVYANLWKFFSESPYHNEFYKKAAGMKDETLFAAGSLKLDEYREPEILDKRGKLIIWAPHHSINNDGLRMGTFLCNHEFFLEFARKHSEFSFVLKPHPALRNVCINSGFDYDNFIEKWEKLPNTNVYLEGGYFEIFKNSDLLITDCSSFLAEYFPSGKPILLLDREDRAPFDEFGEKISKGFYKTSRTEKIEPIISEIFEHDKLKPVREKIINDVFFIPETSAKERIISYLKSNI